MKGWLTIAAFSVWVLSGSAYEGNWGNCKNEIYRIDSGQPYSYGELYYTLGIAMALVFFSFAVRVGVKTWWRKLGHNWIIEIFLICAGYGLKNPYVLHWDKVIIFELSLAGLVILYLTCYLFPGMRKFIL